MKRILLVALLALAAGLLPGCSGSDKEESPFEGNWVIVEYGLGVRISGDRYSITGAGSGSFSYAGDYPDFEIQVGFDDGVVPGTAHFADRQHFQGCYAGGCANFAKR